MARSLVVIGSFEVPRLLHRPHVVGVTGTEGALHGLLATGFGLVPGHGEGLLVGVACLAAAHPQAVLGAGDFPRVLLTLLRLSCDWALQFFKVVF